MALSQQHRSSLYTHLSPLVGAAEAEALLREFPSNDLETPATKDFVRSEVAELRAEVRAEFADVRAELGELRTEVRVGFAEVRAELRAGLADARTETALLRAEMSERFRQQTVWMVGSMATVFALLVAVMGYLSAHPL